MSYIYTMSLRQSILKKESFEELLTLKKKQTNFKSIQKVQLLETIKTNPEVLRSKTAKAFGISTRTQERWLKIYQEKGIEVLIAKQKNSKKSSIITAEIHQGLHRRVYSSNDCFRGYWDAQQWVQDTYGVEVTYFNLRAYMIKHFKTKLKKPRKSHYKKDEHAYESFLKTANTIQMD